MDKAEGDVRTSRAGKDGGVVVLTLDHPPANLLTPPMRLALAAALQAACGAQAVVIRAEGRNFSASTALDPEPVARGVPSLADLCRLLDSFPRPVVVALNGAVIGAGAELALAAHARVADPTTRLIFADVGLGLAPAAGATQRLPRLVGTPEALALLVRARPLPAAEALALGLVDVLAETDLLAAAVAKAEAMPGPRPTPGRRDALSDPLTHAAAIAEARAEARRGVLPAPLRVIDCVEAALYLPFDNGLALEAVARDDLAETPECRGLIAAARAERRAAALPAEVLRARPLSIDHLGLCGGAPQMAALALVALGHGLRVSWHDPDADRLARALDWIAARQAEDVRTRRLSPVQRDADRSRLTALAEAGALAQAGAVVHAAAGPDHARLSRQAKAAPQLVLGGAEGALGLALAPSARATELAVPPATAPETLAAAVQLLRRLGLPPVLVGRMPVVGRRVSGAGRAALARLLALGVPRRVIAAALDDFGQAAPALADPDPPPVSRPMTEAEVLRRWLAAMVNEGLRLVDAGIARRPSDIDVLMVAGHGMPRWRGGPMHHAGTRGLMVLRAEMHDWRADDPLWDPHPLMDRLIAEGRRLADLDGADLDRADLDGA